MLRKSSYLHTVPDIIGEANENTLSDTLGDGEAHKLVAKEAKTETLAQTLGEVKTGQNARHLTM